VWVTLDNQSRLRSQSGDDVFAMLVDTYRVVTIDSVILPTKSLGMPSEVSCEGRLSGGFTLGGFISFANLTVSRSFL